MNVELALGRHRVERRNHHHSIGAQRLRLLRKRDRVGGPLGSGPDENRDATPYLVDHRPYDLGALIAGQGEELAGRAERDQAMDSIKDLELDKAPQRRLIDMPSIARERCH